LIFLLELRKKASPRRGFLFEDRETMPPSTSPQVNILQAGTPGRGVRLFLPKSSHFLL